MMGKLFARIQGWLPQHAISRFVGWLARVRVRPVKNTLIAAASRLYDIDLADALETDARAYASFNAFFTRALAPSARTIDMDPNVIVAPVDGTVSQAGAIEHSRLLQAKGHRYELSALLADDGRRYVDGRFATIYLAPHNYHRVHMPRAATLKSHTYVPGRLFSVNNASALAIGNLFARNERVVFEFDTDDGPMALIMVGALNVGSVETVHHGVVAPSRRREVRRHRYAQPLKLAKGDELARFNLGSTVILLFGPQQLELHASIAAGRVLRLGEAIAQRIDST